MAGLSLRSSKKVSPFAFRPPKPVSYFRPTEQKANKFVFVKAAKCVVVTVAIGNLYNGPGTGSQE